MTPAQYFSLMRVQARMLLRAEASRFRLGFLWWFLEPLLWVAVFYIVFNVILDSGRRSGDFILFLASGKLAFIWFSKSVTQASNSIVASRGLVGKVSMPHSLAPMAEMQAGIYRQLAVYLLLFAILGFGGVSPTLSWLWMLPIAVVTYLMIVACGLIGACLVSISMDFQRVIGLGMAFLMFTSGIFWDVRALSSQEKTDLILALNPLAFLIDAHRQALLYDSAPDVLHMVSVAVVSLALIAVTHWYMRSYRHYLALRVLS